MTCQPVILSQDTIDLPACQDTVDLQSAVWEVCADHMVLSWPYTVSSVARRYNRPQTFSAPLYNTRLIHVILVILSI